MLDSSTELTSATNSGGSFSRTSSSCPAISAIASRRFTTTVSGIRDIGRWKSSRILLIGVKRRQGRAQSVRHIVLPDATHHPFDLDRSQGPSSSDDSQVAGTTHSRADMVPAPRGNKRPHAMPSRAAPTLLSVPSRPPPAPVSQWHAAGTSRRNYTRNGRIPTIHSTRTT